MSYKVEDGNKIHQPYVNLQEVLADKMDVYTIAVYYELKSVIGLKSKDGSDWTLSQRQIAKALDISVSRINKSIKALSDAKIVIIKKTLGHQKSDIIIMRDEDRAWELCENPLEYGTYRTNYRWTLK